MKPAFQRAVVLAVLLAAVLGVLHALGIGLQLLLGLAVVFAVVMVLLPWLGMRWLSELRGMLRSAFWQRDQGRFHSFAGVQLDIEDDGRHTWVAAEGLQRVLGRREADEVAAARHAGHWQRNRDDELMLRVDAVVAVLNTMPGRTDPKVQRLRRYFEREVLYPAARRRELAARPPR